MKNRASTTVITKQSGWMSNKLKPTNNLEIQFYPLRPVISQFTHNVHSTSNLFNCYCYIIFQFPDLCQLLILLLILLTDNLTNVLRLKCVEQNFHRQCAVFYTAFKSKAHTIELHDIKSYMHMTHRMSHLLAESIS